jgi:hypothetical protein
MRIEAMKKQPDPRTDTTSGIPLLIQALAAIVARQAREQQAVVQSSPNEPRKKAA